MLVKIIDNNGTIVWGDAGDIESRVSFIRDEDARGKFVVGSAKLDDGQPQPMKAYLGDSTEERARKRVAAAIMVLNAHVRPRPSAAQIAEHEATGARLGRREPCAVPITVSG